MNSLLPKVFSGARRPFLSSQPFPVKFQAANRWWLLGLLLTGLSTAGWGQQCFNTSTVSLGYTTAPTSGSPAAEAVADFNGDGKLDLAIVGYSNNNVGVLLNTGNGTFGPITMYDAAGNSPRFITTGDFNGDGKPDLATSNVGSNNVSILLNLGGGIFGSPTNFAVGTAPFYIAVGDFNGDGKPDLVTANQNSNNISILLNAGGGAFSGAANFPAGSGPGKVVVGDFNSDSKSDVATLNFTAKTVSILLGNGLGGLGTAATVGTGSSPQDMVVSDFNGDNIPDLAVSSYLGNTVSILLGNGSGGFGIAPTVPVNNNTYDIAVGDFNGDGKVDLVTSNFNSNKVSVVLGKGDGSFGTATTFSTGALAGNISAADFNGDGKLDLSVSNGNDATVSILLGKGDGTFGMAGTVVNPISVVIADFNKDGKPDMAVASFISNNVSVLLNNGSGGFGAATVFMAGSNPTSVAVGDFNKDGNPDLAVANQTSNNISILLGTGTGNFGMAPNVSLSSSKPQTVAVGDVNGDGNPDLLTANVGSGALSDYSIALGDGNGSFGAAKNFSAGYSYFGIAVGDFNGDAYRDFVTTDYIHSRVAVFVSNGTGDISSYQNFGVGDTPISVAVGDFNGDGKADLATANLNSNNVSILLGAGNGTFGVATNYPANSNPYSIVTGDFNSDGKLDLAVTNSTPDKVSILTGNGSGGFGAAASFPVGNNPLSAAVGDFNGDGKPDLVTANHDSNDASLLLNCTATANTPPSVANAIPNQTGTVGQAFTYTIPANTFTDAETPGSLVLSAGGLPAGLSLAGSVISGTPSASGISTVTIKATDPGSLFATTNFTITINPTSGPPISSGPFAITSVTTLGCTPAGGRINVAFNPQYAGINGQPITFRVVNETVPTTNPGPYSVGLYADNPVINLEATQSGVTTTFAYNWLNACSGTTPGNTAPTVANAIPNQSGTVGQAFAYTIPANTFTDAQTPGSLALSASGLPAGLSLAGSTISGTPTTTVGSPFLVTVTATDPGSLAVSTTFTITINPAVGPPPSGTFSITSITTISCTPAGNRINVAFTPNYTALNGQPITFRVVNETVPTTNPGPYSVGLYTDNPVISLEAIQSGITTTFAYNWRAACGLGTRIAAEPSAEFQVRVLGNPVRNSVDFEVTGAEGSVLKLSLTDMQGRTINQRLIEQAGPTERHRFDVSTQPAGVFLLRASTPGQSKTVRVVAVN